MYKEKFCFYCGKYRPADGFWQTVKAIGGSTRKKCPVCVEARKAEINNRAKIKPIDEQGRGD